MNGMHARRWMGQLLLGASFLLAACGGGESSGTVTDPGGGTPTPTPTPTPTQATVTINTVTSVPRINAGSIFGRSGSRSFTRSEFTNSNSVCAFAPARTCTFPVNIGDSLTLVANDVQAIAGVGVYTRLSPDDPRSIESQFVSFSAPCVTRARGVCAFRVTGNVTITAQFKELTLTRYFFSGLNPWEIKITAPEQLTLTNDPDAIVTTFASYGLFTTGVSSPRCIGLAPGERCLFVITPDNATIRMDVHRPQGPTPQGSPGPLNFVGWGGSCAGGPSQFGISACTLASGVDQIAIVRWEHYRCLTAAPTSNPYATEGNSGWKIEPDSRLLTDNRCTLSQ
jgi:hypothetical protein